MINSSCRLPALAAFFAVLAAGGHCAQAAAGSDLLIPDFTGYVAQNVVAGQGAWVIDDPLPSLSYIIRFNQDYAACLGGLYGAPADDQVTLSHPASLPVQGLSLSTQVVFVPSTALFPGQDLFGICVLGTEGQNLLTLWFMPYAPNPELLEVFWTSGDGDPVKTGKGVYYDAPYSVDVSVAPRWSAQPSFKVTLAGTTSTSFTGTLPGAAAKAETGSVALKWAAGGQAFGSNYMGITRLSATRMPVTDADGDGYPLEQEAWFGTSDNNPQQVPLIRVELDQAGQPVLKFPSVAGRSYLIQHSTDLADWSSVPVTATGTLTAWSPATPVSGRIFYRVGKP